MLSVSGERWALQSRDLSLSQRNYKRLDYFCRDLIYREKLEQRFHIVGQIGKHRGTPLQPTAIPLEKLPDAFYR